MGTLHRDVKPENILLSDYGERQLADFGIARVRGGFETASGLISASMTHAAPEIFDGKVPPVASDVYALGSTIFTLMTRHPPFEAKPDDDEALVAMYLRIAADPLPDLRVLGVPDGVSRASSRRRRRTGVPAGLSRRVRPAAAGGRASAVALVSDPSGVGVDRAGNIYITEYSGSRLRRVAVDGTITTVAGAPEEWVEGFEGDGGPATSAKFRNLAAVGIDAVGNVYVTDHQNNRVRKIASDGTVSTIG